MLIFLISCSLKLGTKTPLRLFFRFINRKIWKRSPIIRKFWKKHMSTFKSEFFFTSFSVVNLITHHFIWTDNLSIDYASRYRFMWLYTYTDTSKSAIHQARFISKVFFRNRFFVLSRWARRSWPVCVDFFIIILKVMSVKRQVIKLYQDCSHVNKLLADRLSNWFQTSRSESMDQGQSSSYLRHNRLRHGNW